ncbi:MAG: 3-deoxy-D-manno-octulosonic acid transferase [Bacteroidia bacterium]|nr:MAG: 3-deoxy-D-manno-octulosonic acid transferase [Bacteroidia bacterium]
MKILYSISIYCLILIIRLAALFNSKAHQAISGRKNWRKQLKDKLSNNTAPIIWFHVSSLGEFEQARPLIIQIKTSYPHYKILLTFFSPSGFNARKNFEYADYVFYLPYDIPQNANDFIDIVKPSIVIFVKYEFWLNFLFTLKEKKEQYNIKCFLISSIFRKHQPFFKWYGSIFIDALKVFDKIFVQDELSLRLLKKINFENDIVLAGDTRIDRVIEIAQQEVNFHEIKAFCQSHKIIIAGSTWYPDEKLLIPVWAKLKQSISNIRFIIAPHQVEEKNIQKLIQLFEKYQLTYLRYTQIEKNNTQLNSVDVLIIDTIGILNKIYRFAHIAYIGGGFSDGIHSILEPAVYGLPVIFGKKYQKFYEAVELIKLKGAFSIQNEEEVFIIFHQLINNKEFYHSAQKSIISFIDAHKGATFKTLNVLNNYIHHS